MSSQWDPNGYNLIDGYPKEEFTTRGMQATVQFQGPSVNRWRFVDLIFGRYWIERLQCPQTGGCNIYYRPPLPYITEDLSLSPTQYRNPMWPDTYTIVPHPGANPVTATFTSGVPPFVGLSAPVFSYTCESRIAIRYRDKTHAAWPLEMYPVASCQSCVPQPSSEWGGIYGASQCPALYDSGTECYGFPTIPYGTFIDVKITPELEVQTEKTTYQVDLPAGIQVESPTTELPVLIQKADVPGEQKLYVAVRRYDITWSNLPIVPPHISKAIGKINKFGLLGEPPGSMLMLPYLVRKRQTWHGAPVFDVKLRFVAKTVSIDQLGQDCTTCGYENMTCGNIGLWGRTYIPQLQPWDVCSQAYPPLPEPDEEVAAGCYTNWIKVTDKFTGKPPFEEYDFQRFFDYKDPENPTNGYELVYADGWSGCGTGCPGCSQGANDLGEIGEGPAFGGGGAA